MQRRQKSSANCFHLTENPEMRFQTSVYNNNNNNGHKETHQAPRSKGAASVPEMKVKKKCGRPRNPLPRHKRASHIDAEKRRREKIIWNLGSLGEFVPKAEGSGGRQSKANVLTTAVEQIKELIQDTRRKDQQLAQLRAEKAQIKAAIEEHQNTLPAGELVEARPSLPEERFNDYILKRDWKYFLFSFIMKPLFGKFEDTVDGSTIDSCKNSVWQWARENMSLHSLRITATDRMAAFNKQTDFANKSSPETLQEKIQQLMLDMTRQRHGALGTPAAQHNQVSPLRESLSSLCLESHHQHGFQQLQQQQQHQQQQNLLLQHQTCSSGRGRQSRKRTSSNADVIAARVEGGRNPTSGKRAPPKKSRARRTPTPPNMPRTPAHRRVVYTLPNLEHKLCYIEEFPTAPTQVSVKTETMLETLTADPMRNSSSPDSFGSLVPSPCMSSSSLPSDFACREDLGYGTSSNHGSRGNSPPSTGGSPSPFRTELVGYQNSLFSYDPFGGYDTMGLAGLQGVSALDPTSSSSACEVGHMSNAFSDSAISSLFAGGGHPSDIFSDCAAATYAGSFEVQQLRYGQFQPDSGYQEHCQRSHQPVQHFKREPHYPEPSFQDLGVFDMNCVLNDEAVATFGSHVDSSGLDVDNLAGFGAGADSGALSGESLSSLWIDTIVNAMGSDAGGDLGVDKFDIESFLNDSSTDQLPLAL